MSSHGHRILINPYMISSKKICKRVFAKLRKIESLQNISNAIKEAKYHFSYRLKGLGSKETRRMLKDARRELRKWKRRKLDGQAKYKISKKIEKLNEKIQRIQLVIRVEKKVNFENNFSELMRANIWKAIPFGKNATTKIHSIHVEECVINSVAIANSIMSHLHRHPDPKSISSFSPVLLEACPPGCQLDKEKFLFAVNSL